jgi:hypothetical protein
MTTKHTKYTKLAKRSYPQISQIFTDKDECRIYSICENLRNLWFNSFVNKLRSVKWGLN